MVIIVLLFTISERQHSFILEKLQSLLLSLIDLLKWSPAHLQAAKHTGDLANPKGRFKEVD
jgi:hypothetical protein